MGPAWARLGPSLGPGLGPGLAPGLGPGFGPGLGSGWGRAWAPGLGPDAAAGGAGAGRILRSQSDPSPNAPRDQRRRKEPLLRRKYGLHRTLPTRVMGQADGLRIQQVIRDTMEG